MILKENDIKCVNVTTKYKTRKRRNKEGINDGVLNKRNFKREAVQETEFFND